MRAAGGRPSGALPMALERLRNAQMNKDRREILAELSVRGPLAASTAKWRATLVEPGFSCAVCAARPGAHCFVSLGQDDEGAALIYGCPARASEGGEVEKTVLHCVNSLEKQWGAQGAAPQQWVWIVDFNGFGLTHAMQARLGISFVR